MRLALAVSACLIVAPIHVGAAVFNPATVSTVNQASFVRGAPMPRWAQTLPEIPSSERPDPVLIRMADTQVSLTETPAVLYSRAIQVNDSGSLAEIGQFSITYAPAYQKLLVHKVIILRNGELIDRTASVNMRALEREQQLEQGMYGGEVTLQMLMHDVRVGDTLWVTYTIEGHNPVFGKRWSQIFGWDSAGPTELRRLVVSYPKRRPVYWRQLGDFRTTELKPKREQFGAEERLVFTEKAIDALENEISIPSDYVPGRILQFSEYENWGDVAQWAVSMFPEVKPSTALRSVAKSLEGGATPALRAAAALHWVQDEVRYFSVSIGENSHRPQAPDAVLSRRYGDCKDKSYLLTSLLRLLGIEARPVLVSAQSPKLPARMLPSPKWFDHVIVKISIDGADYYVDPTQTGQTESLAELPVALAGGVGLVVDPKSVSLLTIPEDPSVAPHLEIQEDLKLDGFDTPAELTSRRYYRGKYAAWARRLYTGSAQANLKKLALEHYEKTYPGIKLVEGPKFADVAGRMVVTSRFEVPKPAELKDGRYAVAFDSKVMDGTLGIPDKLVRNFPFAPVSGRYKARYRMRLQWPEQFRSNNEQTSKLLDTAQFSASEHLIQRGSFLDYTLDYKIKTNRVEAEDLPEMQQQAKGLNQFAQGSFRVNADWATSKERMSLTTRQLSSFLLHEQLNYYRATLDGATLANLPPERLCGYLSTLYMQQDRLTDEGRHRLTTMDQALPDLLSRAEVAPCIAYAYFTRGRFKESVASYRASKFDESSSAQVMLAWSQLLSGAPKDALAAMELYYKGRKNAGLATMSDVANLAAFSLRAGKPLPPDLISRAESDAEAQWPRPILAMYAGALTAEQLLAIAGKLPRDAGIHALNDAWFHIGQVRLSEGDRAGAKAAFTWFRSQGLVSSMYYQVARAELAVLDNGTALREAMEAYRRKDQRAGLALLQRAAAGGDPAAEFELAVVYHSGTGVKQDFVLARDWYAKAAEQGHSQAQRELAVLQGQPAGMSWLQKAADGNNGDALFDLAVMYARGDNGPQDLRRAFDFALRAAEAGQVQAQAFVASAYGLGVPVEANWMQSMYWAMRARAADLYDIEPMYSALAEDKAAALGTLFVPDQASESGAPRVPVALNKASRVEQAISNKYLLAFMYQNGFGMPKDAALARKLYQECAAGGLPQAWYYLALMNKNGLGAPADKSLALEQMTRAAKAGLPEAQFLLARFYVESSVVATDLHAAARWFSEAAAQGDSASMNELGDLYERGAGVGIDLKRAYELYSSAARAGNSMGFYSLGALFEKGIYVKRDLSLAYTYYLLAARLAPRVLKWETVQRISKELSVESKKMGDFVALDWKLGQPLPGLNEASASPAGRE